MAERSQEVFWEAAKNKIMAFKGMYDALKRNVMMVVVVRALCRNREHQRLPVIRNGTKVHIGPHRGIRDSSQCRPNAKRLLSFVPSRSGIMLILSEDGLKAQSPQNDVVSSLRRNCYLSLCYIERKCRRSTLCDNVIFSENGNTHLNIFTHLSKSIKTLFK